MPMLLLSLFLTNPAPLEMPRAEAYLVRDGDRSYLEDRFDRLDLWTSRTVDGRWIDDEGRVFTLATLAVRPPALASGAAETRVQYAASCVPIDRRKREDDECPHNKPDLLHRPVLYQNPATDCDRGTCRIRFHRLQRLALLQPADEAPLRRGGCELRGGR